MIAQDLEKVAPYMVGTLDGTDIEGLKYISQPLAYQFLLVNGIKEIYSQVTREKGNLKNGDLDASGSTIQIQNGTGQTVLSDGTIQTGLIHGVRLAFEALSGYIFDTDLSVNSLTAKNISTQGIEMQDTLTHNLSCVVMENGAMVTYSGSCSQTGTLTRMLSFS